MTKEEVRKVLTILCAYYEPPKIDPADMLNAWYLALKDEDYGITTNAVVRFAKNDRRDYPKFPALGQIIGAVENEHGKIVRIRNSALNKEDYIGLDPICKEYISEERYNKLKECNEDYLMNLPQFKEHLLAGVRKLE